MSNAAWYLRKINGLTPPSLSRQNPDGAEFTGVEACWTRPKVERKPRYTPRGAPAILHFPAVGAGTSSIAHCLHSVVEPRPTRRGERARRVEPQGGMVCLDIDGHGLLRHSRHHCLLVVFGHVCASGHFSMGECPRCNETTHSVGCCVTVAILGADRILLGKRKCVVHQTTIATLTGSVTIYELLFAQRHETARDQGPDILQSARV